MKGFPTAGALIGWLIGYAIAVYIVIVSGCPDWGASLAAALSLTGLGAGAMLELRSRSKGS